MIPDNLNPLVTLISGFTSVILGILVAERMRIKESARIEQMLIRVMHKNTKALIAVSKQLIALSERLTSHIDEDDKRWEELFRRGGL